MTFLNSKTTFWNVSSVVAFAIIQEASHHLKQQQNVWNVFMFHILHLLVFLNILHKIWTVYHWHVYIMLCQNMKHILPSAETELVWQKRASIWQTYSPVLGIQQSIHMLGSYNNNCLGTIFSCHSQNVTFLLAHPYC